jgi:hypothetical protein
MTHLIVLPVSLGEAMDKLAILDIKLTKISDHRREDVQTEYDLLYGKLEPFRMKYADLYQTLKRINLCIWDMMEQLRDGELPEPEYFRVCKQCVEYNDIRFRVKHKINTVSNSTLKEQKGYKIQRILIEINDQLSNITDFIPSLKYVSFLYDEIVVRSSNEALISEFAYDTTVQFTTEIQTFDYKHRFSFLANHYTKDQIRELFGISVNGWFD